MLDVQMKNFVATFTFSKDSCPYRPIKYANQLTVDFLMISYYYAINFHLGFPSLSVSGLKYLLNS